MAYVSSRRPDFDQCLRQQRRLSRRRQIRRRRLVAAAVLLALLALIAVTLGVRDEGAKRPGEHFSGLGPIRAGSDPSVLPGPILIADSGNNRLIEVSPRGHILWRFPRDGDLRRGQSFRVPDDAFFASNGRYIVATQEDNFVISVIDVARHRIVYRYGKPGVPGSGPNRLYNPDDALLMSGGKILAADIKNCRLIVLRPPSHVPLRQMGSPGLCAHDPPLSFSSPNGAFPAAGGRTIVTEINGDWVDVLSRDGRLLAAANPPGFTYPSDTNQIRGGVLLSANYASPGAVETFTTNGKLLWRYAPHGSAALDHPSLALPLPNGDILANDDHNDRVIVIDPHTNQIVWQYGHTSRPGRGPGYLSDPDGVDPAPPNSLMRRFSRARPPR